MAILIKDMEMPESCGLCKLYHAESPMYCMAVDGHKTVGAPYGMPRPDWCPLVEVAEVQDAVSRQAAIKEAESWVAVDGREKHLQKDVIEWLKGLPSAQPEPIRINLNEPIKVKLTDWGKEIYYHQYDRTNQIAGREICKPSFPREDENGYTEFHLWRFIELYGMHMGMTLPNVIEPLEIVYER